MDAGSGSSRLGIEDQWKTTHQTHLGGRQHVARQEQQGDDRDVEGGEEVDRRDGGPRRRQQQREVRDLELDGHKGGSANAPQAAKTFKILGHMMARTTDERSTNNPMSAAKNALNSLQNLLTRTQAPPWR